MTKKEQHPKDTEADHHKTKGGHHKPHAAPDSRVVELDGDEDLALDDQIEQINAAAAEEAGGNAKTPNWEAICLAREKDHKELNERFLRMAADFENHRKRVARERNDLLKYGHEALLLELLPVKDDLELALKSAEESHHPEALLEGVKLILGKFTSSLQKFGVQAIPAKGEKFNPQFHEALSQFTTDQYPDESVMEEFKKGYTYYDRLLRPSQVVVAKNPTAAAEPAAEPAQAAAGEQEGETPTN